ncbi:ThyX-like thymidylate synthase [Rhodococcus phage MacGully]|nr:ThyX-like thymidylate synthase [Rhodococcus phage MacGully]
MSKSKRARLDVQLIGHTVFIPPSKEAEDGNTEPIFWPDESNELPTALGHLRQFDGQALAEFAGRVCYQSFHRPSEATATNAGYLLNTIGKQKHWSIAEHGSVSFYFQGVSRSLTHELVRHRHFAFSQLSQRYVGPDGLTFVVPPKVLEFFGSIVDEQIAENGQPINRKTGEPGTREDVILTLADEYAKQHFDGVSEAYGDWEKALRTQFPEAKTKVIREASRAELPNATEAKLVMTGNYRSWAEFLVKRDSPAADAEIRRLAQEVGRQLAEHAPNIFGPEARALWDDSAEHGEAQH